MCQENVKEIFFEKKWLTLWMELSSVGWRKQDGEKTKGQK
jgi:hypothetical protein